MRELKNKFLRLLYFLTTGSQFEFVTGVRRQILRWLLGQELEGLLVRPHVYISGYKNLKIGKHVSLNHYCFLSCEGGLEIGDYVGIGHGTSIITTAHTTDGRDTPMRFQPMTYAPVRIGSNVLIGAKVTILAGVTIADGTVITTGSVVTSSIEKPDTIVGGVGAARFLRNRLPSSEGGAA